jgi:hypothetical protein
MSDYRHLYHILRVSKGLHLILADPDHWSEYKDCTLVMQPVGSTYIPSQTKGISTPHQDFIWLLQVSVQSS